MCFSRPRSVRFPTLDQNLAQALKGYGTGRTIWRGLQALEQPAHLGPESPTPCRGRVSEGGAPPCHAAPWAELSASLRWRPATIRSGVCGLSRSSSPQVIQCGLLPRCGKVFPARLVINQVDDDVPHDRTPLLIRGCDTSHSFPGVFAGPRKWLRQRDGMVSRSLHDDTASRVRDPRNSVVVAMVQSTTRPSGI